MNDMVMAHLTEIKIKEKNQMGRSSKNRSPCT